MSQARTKAVDPTIQRKTGEQAQARTLLLVLVCLLLGLAAGAYWWYYRDTNRNLLAVGETRSSLSESTKALLKALASPVEIRFYSLLDPASTSEDLRNFSGRVDQLLSEYESEAGGKIKLVRQTTRTNSAAQAASADGLRAFNLDKGDACFLGAAVVCNDQKETLGQLSPVWEASLESDLNRAITRVTAARPAIKIATTNTTQVDAAIVEEIRRVIPNFDAVSLAEGKAILDAAEVKEVNESKTEGQRRFNVALQHLIELETNGSFAEQGTAAKELKRVDGERWETVSQVSARCEARIRVWKQIKNQ